MILAIDPGASTCACAWFGEGGELRDVEFNQYPEHERLTMVVVERMQADSRTRNIDVRNLLDCQFSGALAAGNACGATRHAEMKWLTPTQWKGSEPKPTQHARLFGVNAEMTGRPAILSVAEQAILGGEKTRAVIAAAVKKGALDRWSKPGVKYYPAAFDTHNLLDAVALGLFVLGRLRK